jgi:hypothetical protein
MKPLPAGFRVVGALTAVYAAFTGGCLVAAVVRAQSNLQPNPRPAPSSDLLDWLALLCFSLTSVIAVLAGCLLFLHNAAALRAARVMLVVVAVGLALEAVLMVPVTLQAARSSSTGALAVFVTAPVFVMASALGVANLITAVKLGRHLRP